jgi:transposase
MSTNGKRKRRTFSEEFKRDAVNLVVVEGYTIAAAAKAVNVLDGSLREWHRKGTNRDTQLSKPID